MEKTPSREHAGDEDVARTAPSTVSSRTLDSDWRHGLPALAGSLVMLRDLRATDAASLFNGLSTHEVSRFISAPPATLEAFERFIAWTHEQRTAGQHASFAIVPRGSDTAVGLFQIRSLERDFGTAEWGFALAPEVWGTGFFGDGARLAMAFAFDMLGTYRLEARAVVTNGRGNAALRKLGASREGVLRRSFMRYGEHHDQALWTILAEDWREALEGAGQARRIH